MVTIEQTIVEVLIAIALVLIIPMIAVGMIAFVGLCLSLYRFLRYGIV